MAPNPVVTFAVPAQTAFIGTTQTVKLSFDNTAAGAETGYAPYIDVILPINGADGGGVGNNPVNDGVTLLGATFLGRALVQTPVVFNAAGQATHPFAKDAAGNPPIVTGPPGDTLLVLTLPFGSFTTEQTPADVTLTLGVSNLADVGTPLPIRATGGFAYGADEFNNPTADAPIRGATATAQIDPIVAVLTKTYVGPEQETATGPSYPREWLVQGEFAAGQPFTNVVLTDRMPDGVIITGAHLEDGNGNVLPGTAVVTGAYGSQIVTGTFTGTIIGGAVKPTLVIDYYVTEFLSTGAPVLDQSTGAFRPLENNAKLDADWTPIDTRDRPAAHIVIDPAGPENVVTAKSVAVQKSVALVSPTDDTVVNPDADHNGVPDWQPGGTLKYTLDGQVSNYFEMKSLVMKDTLGDGQTFKSGYTPHVVIREHGAVIYSGDVLYTVQPKDALGHTFIQFDIAGTLVKAKADGLITDDAVLDGNGGTLEGNPHSAAYNQATAVVTFETTIDHDYAGPIAPGLDRLVDQGDPINNDVLFGGQVNGTGNTIEDDSHAGVVLPVSAVDKSIYAINGDTALGATIATTPSRLIQAGDLITFRLNLDLPLTSAHSVKLTDYLPLPVLRALDLDANGSADGAMGNAPDGTIPGVNQWSFGPTDNFEANSGGLQPSITRSGPGNSLTFNFGDVLNVNYPTTHLDLLFTVRVNDAAFGDGLLLTNQVTSSETNSFGAVSQDNEIVQFVLGEPRIKITKGVVAEDNTASGYFDAATGPAGVNWGTPGSATSFTGTINSNALAATPVNANLFQADANDTVKFAVVLENLGSGPRGAFDLVIKDTIPAGFTLGAAPLNLKVTDGTGATLAYTGNPADLFTTGIQLTDPALHQGAVGAYSATSGKNVVVVTYDLKLDSNVQAYDRLTNTATTASYGAEEGGISRTPTDNLVDTDTAFVEITPKIGKMVIATSNGDTGASEGNAGLQDLAIGETVTWRVTLAVPEGMTKGLMLKDILPGGLGAATAGKFELLSATTATVGSNIMGAGVAAGSTGTIIDSNGDGINDTVTYNFGNVTNAADNAETAADRITFDVVARVLDNGTNVRGHTETNTGIVSATAPDGTTKTTTVTSSVEIVEPVLSIDKTSSVATVDADDTFTYTVTLTNTTGSFRAPAYDISIDDLLSQLAPNAVYVPGFLTITAAPAGANAAIVTGNGASDSTVKVTADKLLEGQSITLTFRAKATAGAISGQTIHNDATAHATSEPGTPPSDRPYDVTNPNDITIASPSISKSVFATSFGDTGSAQFSGANQDVKVDEIVTYRMVVTVPEGQSINFRVIDTLADQLVGGSSGLLQYIPGSAKVVSAGANLSSAGGILTPAVTATDGNGNGTTETVTYSFGTVTNTADNVSDGKDQIVFEIQARAQNVNANQNADVLTNSVQAKTDFSQSAIAAASVDFVQPELDIQKGTTFTTGDAADVATYTVTIRHTGNSTNAAYNLAMGDLLAPGITLVPGSASTNRGTISEAAGHISLNLASLGLDESVTITYRAKLADNVVNGQSITNTATLDYQTDPTPGRILHDTDDATIAVRIQDSIVKDLISTDNSYTPGSNVVAGETITYKLTVTLGEGAQHLIVDDVLPTGLTAVSSRVLSLGNIAGSSTLHVGDAGTQSGQTVTFDFGDVINAGDNTLTAGDKVEIEVVARVAPGTAGNLALTNTATVRPVTPNNPYNVPVGTPMTPSSDTETVNTLALPKLGDKAFDDLNADGIQQAGEPGIQGVTVQLYSRDTGLLVGTQTTNAQGLYLFTDLKPGTYYEVWSLPSGFVRTTQDVGPDGTDSDASAVNGVTADLVMLGGQDDLTRDAGYWKPVKIGDTVTEDVNGNGIQDAGDVPLAGKTVNLLNGMGAVVGSAVTDALGNYLFVGLKPGTYSVEFVKPPGYAFTLKDVGNDALDSDADLVTGRTVAKTYISGDDDRSIDAGLYRPVTIGDRVFEDQNGNGVQDGGDTNLAGVTVQLLNGANAVVGTAVTDVNGNYLFTGLRPDSYHIKVVPPAGYVFTTANTPYDAVDSDTDQVTGISPVKTYLSGDDDRTVDSGLYRPVKIGDLAFFDRNGDGIQNAGDTPLGGVVVQLVNTVTNTVVATATTAADGSYLFTVPPGTYKEIWTTPPGFTPAITGQGTPATDSNPVGGMTTPITLTSGQSDLTQDAGFWQPVTIGDRVFEDQNGNDIQDAGDTNIANVRVDLLDGAGMIVATQFTDINGNYLFTGLRPQDYAVKFTPPTGYNFTGRDVGNDSFDSDANLATGVTVTKTYLAGDDDRTIDAGLWRPVTLGDRVTEDKNGNGIQDAGDVALPGATVNLLNAAGTVVGTTTTDANGNYLFTGLKPGTYSVEFVKPPGFVFSPVDVGNDATDSDANIVTGRSTPALHTSGTTDLTIDASLYVPVKLGDRVFLDVNGNGIQDGADTNLAGVTVNLLNGANAVIGSTSTDANGNYLFTGLAPGAYHVQVIKPDGTYFFTTPDAGPDNIDSDTSTLTGITPVKVYVSGDDDRTIDSGLYQLAKIGDYAFVDRNGNGINDAGDTALGGVTVQLVNTASNTVVATAVTAADGSYLFNVPPGTYKEIFTAPAGYVPTIQGQGTPATDSNPDGTGTTPTFYVPSGGQDLTIDAGFSIPVKIGDRVFEDQNGNGIQDAEDTNLGGVTVNLLNGAGTVVGTQTTDANGNYLFQGLRPMDYQVQFVKPAGFITTAPDVGVNDTIDSDASLAGGKAPVKTYYSGDDDRTIDAGYYRPVTIGDHAFVDINKDGLQQTLEPGLAGVIVTLIDDRTGMVVGTQTTGVTGDYLFTGYKPSEYHVEFSTPTGYSITTQMVGPNRAIDSNPNAAGVAPQIRLLSGQTDLTIDAGYQGSGKVSGNVFLDLPPGICNYKLPDAVFAGIKVELITTTGLIAGTTTTDANGNYSFDHVAPGQYVERFTNPDGTVFTQPKVAGTLNPRDSDVNPNGLTDAFTVANGDDIRMINAGLDYTGVGFQGQAPTYLPDGGGSFNYNGGAYAIGGNGSYNMTGSNGAVYFIGGSGSNNLQGSGASGAILMGGGGSNIMEGTAGRDIIIGGCGPNSIQGLGSNNFQGLGGGNACFPYDLLIGGVSNDTITSNSGNAIITGNLGNDNLDGQGVFVGGPNDGTVSYNGTTITGYSVGDHLKLSGTSQVNYQLGDGVQLIENYNPGRGDTIEVYGYAAPTATGLVNGQYVLYFGPNAALVISGYQPQNGVPLTGINYHPNQSSMPGAFGHFDPLPPVILAAGTDSFTGTQGDDIAIGTDAFTTFTGNGGDDVAFGGEGGNLFLDGAGNDTYVGGRGNDIFRITEGSNQVIGCEGNNVVQFNVTRAQATITANANGTFTVVTPTGEQVLRDIQWLSFTDQNVHLPGVADAAGAVRFGTAGDDAIQVTDVHDLIVERPGQGNDTAYVAVNGWTLSPEVENGRLYGNATDLTGNAMDNVLVANPTKASLLLGGGGNDDLWGGTAADTLNGGAGDDVMRSGTGVTQMIGGTGNDQFVVNNAADTIMEKAGEGTDTAWVGVSNWTVSDNVEIVRLFGGATNIHLGSSAAQVVADASGSTVVASLGDNVFWGNGGADTFVGAAGNDTFYAGGGVTKMYGGAGNDSFVIKNLGDQAFENAGEGYDVAYVAVGGWTVGNNIEVAYLSGGATTLTGNATGGNLVANGTAASTLTAGAGQTVFWGSNFGDTFNTGPGGSTLYGYGGADDFHFGAPHWGLSQIADFSHAEGDKLDFQGSGIANMGQLSIINYADKVQITHGADEIILYGVTAPLVAADFIF